MPGQMGTDRATLLDLLNLLGVEMIIEYSPARNNKPVKIEISGREYRMRSREQGAWLAGFVVGFMQGRKETDE